MDIMGLTTRGESEKLCLGICGGEVAVWLVQGGVHDYVMNEACPNANIKHVMLLKITTLILHGDEKLE
jgi:metallophosphoesterase superfamily enzyme